MNKLKKMNMLEKKCRDCEIIKDIKEFYKNISTKDGYQYKCKVCVKKEYDREYSRRYYEENKDRILEKRKKYREENRDKIKENKKKYREENKDRLREYDRKYREENRDIINEWNREYQKNRTLEDPLYKLKKRMRTLINNSLKNGGYTKNSKSRDILGCSYEELLDHLNDNKYGFIYGDDNLDIDHIVPLSRATSEEEIIELNHYSNLQLLPAGYNRNIKRDNDFDKEDFEEWLEKKN